MTKTLTEQWREGTLPAGSYYVKDWDGKINRFLAQNNILWRDSNNPIYASERIEILAPVPSYEEYSQKITKIEKMKLLLDKNTDLMMKINFEVAGQVQKINNLQNQLKEANKVISHYAETNGYMKAIKYLNKWCVE